MEFIMVLPIIVKQHDAIMTILDNFKNYSHFIPMMPTFKVVNIAEICIKEFFKFHGISTTTLSDIDLNFTSRFWKLLFESLGAQLNSNTSCIHKYMGEQKEKIK